MKKRSVRGKAEEKTHKHSRRKRKSSSEESDEGEAGVQNDQPEETKTRRGTRKVDKEPEINATAVGRVTRNSRRLAAINASVEEVKELTPEVQSPIKTGKSSPFSSGSPNKDRKKDGTPDKHKSKDDGWKIQSANGSGTGGIQKLKICRQRSPQPEHANDSDSNRDVENIEEVQGNENNADASCGNDIQQISLPDEDVANIKLPNSEPVESIRLPDQPPVTEPLESIQLPEEREVVQAKMSESTEKNSVPLASSIVVENIELPPEPQSQPVIESKQLEKECNQTENSEVPKAIETTDEPSAVQDGKYEAQVVLEENKLVVESKIPESVTVPEKPEEVVSSPQQAEQDDAFQPELVLTVEDIEEPVVGLTSECDQEDSKKTEKSTKRILPSLSQMEMEEVYDYENDDTKEEGELSGNEASSPIHEVFKKLPADERKRNWGFCNVFQFTRSNITVNEEMLKNRNIVKKVLNKDELEASDTEDLIFVKEIREENIVHEIESETNNTSLPARNGDKSPSPGESDSRRPKYTLESDKIEASKRYSKESKTVSADGRTVLFITNLVRPFTFNQLKELLQRTGKILDIWMDKIKSKCYVQFENEDQATETRHALHGTKWPVNNPKTLHVRFATIDDMIAAQVKTDESEIPRKTEPLVISNHNSDPSQRRLDWKKHLDQYDERPARKLRDVREWDIGKPAHPDEMVYSDVDDHNKKEMAEPHDRNRRDRKRRNETPEEDLRAKRHRKPVTDTKPPTESKLLDDLFRRTKASPSIYWLPLTEEQIVVKEEAKRKREEERENQRRANDRDRELRGRDRERRRSRR